MSAPIPLSSGALIPASGSEDFIFEGIYAGIYEVLIRLNNMITADAVTIRLYRSPEQGVPAHPSYLEESWSLINAQTNNLFSVGGPKGNAFQDGIFTVGMAVSLEQTAGTLRNFDYTIISY